MSYQPLWLRDFVAYSIQLAAVFAVGAILPRVLSLHMPKVRLAYWQGLLALCVFLPLLQSWKQDALMLSEGMAGKIGFGTASGTISLNATNFTVSQIIFSILLAGIILRAVWIALGFMRLRLYRRRAQLIPEPPVSIAEAQRLIPVFPALYISYKFAVPATFGFFRPVILLPHRFFEMTSPMQKAIAFHELLHVARRDWAWNLAEEIALTLLWFHPAIWWLVRNIRLSREQVIDAEVMRRSNSRRSYVQALLEIAQQKSMAYSLPASLLLRESQLAERVAVMMKEVRMSKTRLVVCVFVAAVALLVTGKAAISAFPLKTPAPGALRAETPSTIASVGQGIDSSPDKVYKVGGDVQPPKPVFQPDPHYTQAARKAHVKGAVKLVLVIDADGKVASIKETSQPLGKGLDESALNTVRTWRFKPAVRNGAPVTVQVQAEITFKLY